VAVVRVSAEEPGTIRPGDAVFDTREHEAGFPLHVGVYVGDREPITPRPALLVQGLPRAPGKGSMKTATWGTDENYQPDEVGQRLDVDEVEVALVCLYARGIEAELPALGHYIQWKERREIDPTRVTRDGLPLFVRGTCSHYVEFLYEYAELDLVDEERTPAPENEGRPRDEWRLHPMTQLHAFWRGSYPLAVPWDARLADWDECLFGERATAR